MPACCRILRFSNFRISAGDRNSRYSSGMTRIFRSLNSKFHQLGFGKRTVDVRGRGVVGQRFRNPKVEHLQHVVVPDFQVGGLKVTVNNSPLMGIFECIGKLLRQLQSFLNCNEGPHDPFGQSLPLNQFHDQGENTGGVLRTVNSSNVRVVQCRKKLGFAFETSKTLLIGQKKGGQHLERDMSRRSLASAARQTSPLPPAPSGDRIS